MAQKLDILALDLATKTGFAHSSGASGVWDLSIRPDESSGMRLIRFRGKLLEVYQSAGIDVIAFEAVSVFSGKKSNSHAAKLQSKLQAVLELFCEEHGVQCQSYNIQQIKSHALPPGTPRNKLEMVRAAQEKWHDRIITSSDEADALWLLDLALTNLLGRETE